MPLSASSMDRRRVKYCTVQYCEANLASMLDSGSDKITPNLAAGNGCTCMAHRQPCLLCLLGAAWAGGSGIVIGNFSVVVCFVDVEVEHQPQCG